MDATEQDISDQRQLLNAHRQTLYGYLLQQAKIGQAHIHPSVLHGINESRAEIRRIKEVLRSWGQEIDDHPNDEASSNKKTEPVDPTESQIPTASSKQSRLTLPVWLTFLVVALLLGSFLGRYLSSGQSLQTIPSITTQPGPSNSPTTSTPTQVNVSPSVASSDVSAGYGKTLARIRGCPRIR